MLSGILCISTIIKKSSISLICTCLKRISCSYTQFFIEWKYRFPVFWQLYQLFYNKYNFIFLHTAIKIVYVCTHTRTFSIYINYFLIFQKQQFQTPYYDDKS